MFALLDASFLAVVQVVVYIGAIAIMFIFAVMLTRKEMRDKGPQVNRHWPQDWSLCCALACWSLSCSTWSGFNIAVRRSAGLRYVAQLGVALTSPNALSCHLKWHLSCFLAALIGSVYVAMNKK